MSAFCRTVELSSSIDAAVSCSAEACCSVRALRSWLPWAICALAVATLSAFSRTMRTTAESLPCMDCMACSSCAISSVPRLSTCAVRSPSATWRARFTARSIGWVMLRLNSTPPVMPTAHTSAISARLMVVARVALASAAWASAALSSAIFFTAASSSRAGSRSMPLTALSPTAWSKPEALNASNAVR